MKKFIPLLCLIFIAAGCNQQSNKAHSQAPTNIFSNNLIHQKQLEVKSIKLDVEVATTVEQKEKGLSGRNKLAANEGMLFDFTNDANQSPGFWMKEMNFNLDLIWIQKGKIIAIDNNVGAPPKNTPTSSLPVYYPPENIDYVLEVDGGWSKENNISVGDKAIVLK